LQEEIEKKSVQLAIRVTEKTLSFALRKIGEYLREKKADRKQKKRDEMLRGPKGEQSVKDLIGQGQGVSTMDVGDSGIRDFKKIAKKYGVDFAIVKDKGKDPPVYTCFFKAKDADAILKVLDEYTNKQVKKQKKVERPSVLEKLKKFKEIVAKIPRKEKEKRKEHER